MKRVTLLDVAQHAGVSRAAASLVVRGTGRISEETRERVRASMRELGYVYHRGAAALRTRSSATVGIVVTDISNPSLPKIALGIEARLAAAGYITMLSNSFDHGEREIALLRTMIETPVDALIYIPATGQSADVATLVRDSGIPALALTRETSSVRSYLGPDNELGGRLAAEHLISVHGCRRIAYLGGPSEGSARQERLRGVEAEISRVPGAELAVRASSATTVDGARRVVEQALAGGIEFDGVVGHSDLVAYALVQATRGGGMPVPVVGFDDLPTSAIVDPPITSVTVPEFGVRAAERVLELMEGAPAAVQRIAPELIIRQSCGCA